MKQEHPYLLCIKDWIFSTIFSNFKFIPLIFCYTIYIYIYFRIHSKVSKAPTQQNGCRTHTGLVATQQRSSDALIRLFFFLDSHWHARIRADSGQNLPKTADIGWNLPNHHSWTLFNLPNQNPPFRYFSKYTQKSQNTSCKSTLIRNLCTWPSI